MPNYKFENALARKPQSCPPIWFMRQAGRYHKHYQSLRKKHSFEELCKKPELAAETALGPIEDFDFDVAILFSDILWPLQAMGMNLVFDPGPKFEDILTEQNFKKLLNKKDLRFMEFQSEALQLTKEKLGHDKVAEMFCLCHCYENNAFHYDGENYPRIDIEKIDQILKGG